MGPSIDGILQGKICAGFCVWIASCMFSRGENRLGVERITIS